MAGSEGESSVARLVELLAERLRKSEWEILTALAAADSPMTVEELAEETGYTERTIKKRVDTLAERVHSETLLSRDEDGNPTLHPQFARVVRDHQAED